MYWIHRFFYNPLTKKAMTLLPVEDEVAKALAILKKHGVIKDGQIVNL